LARRAKPRFEGDTTVTGDLSARVGIVYRSQDFALANGALSLKAYHAGELRNLTGATGLDYLSVYESLGPVGFEKYVKKWVTDNEIRILFFVTTLWLEFDTELLLWLSQRVFIVHWMFDDVTEFDVFSRYYGQFADLVLVEDYVTALRYEQMGVSAHFRTPIYSAEMYSPMDLPRSVDVSMVGILAAQGRGECVRRLRQEGFAVATYGVDSPAGPVSLERMREIFCTSKVNLNTAGVTPSRRAARDPSVALRRQIKGRITEVALTRSFVLTEYSPGLEQAWGIDTEIGVFHTHAELIAKTRYYLSHDDEREAISSAAYARAIRDYAGPAAFARVFEEVLARFYETDWAAKQTRTKPPRLGEDVGRIVVANRLGRSWQFARAHSWRAAGQEMSIACTEASSAARARRGRVCRPARYLKIGARAVLGRLR
jgi:spore maturation protein CgeB